MWIEDEDSLFDKVDETNRALEKGVGLIYYKGGMDPILKEISVLELLLEKQQEAEGAEGFDGL